MPIMWSTSAGRRRDEAGRRADGRRPRTSFLMELLVYPAIYLLWKKRARSRAPASSWWAT
jgi:hypothetical protein